MNFWIFFLVPIGGLIIIAVLADTIAKIRGTKVNLERNKRKSKNKTGDIYSQSLKNDNNPFR